MSATSTAVTSAKAQRSGGSPIRGWNWMASLFLAPALLLLGVFMLYPVISTIVLSFDRGLGNYIRLLTADRRFLDLSTFPPSGALFNNVLWVVFYTSGCIFFGLLIAVLATRVRYEQAIKAIVFLPMAIAATALGVIWRFVYTPDRDTGLLNALLGIFHLGPIAFLGDTGWVNTALIIAGIWGSVGFATVILSAALKGISTEVLEAARVDGARESQIFRRIIIPMLSLPISVVAVTLVINVIKLFDLIYVMTAGGPGSSSRVIAFTMYQEAFPAGRVDYGAAVAVMMLVILIPVLIFNVRRFRSERVVQ
ncbi:MAG: sugar ABC transporter permease [Chloroflexota bacterium]|nr:sugar ABC transporter permease [Chloroflexota bacterium]